MRREVFHWIREKSMDTQKIRISSALAAERFSEETGLRVGFLGFSNHQMAVQRCGWIQARYYSDDASDSVREFLKFDHVFDVNPFEVGVPRTQERREFRSRYQRVLRLLQLRDLLPKAFISLSNGELRRVLLARELLRNPQILVLDNPFNGLDPIQSERLKDIILALEKRGIRVVVNGDRPGSLSAASWVTAAPPTAADAAWMDAVRFDRITVKFGRRVLFKNFSWRIGRGERWVLRGRNGSGKTLLMALITGDSPLAYSIDVTVLGQKREVGKELGKIRRKIAMVSPEMQAYLGRGPEELLDEALAKEPELLILDEPCMNLGMAAAKRLCRKVAGWLKVRPNVTAICIAHRPEHVPAGFGLEMDLDLLGK